MVWQELTWERQKVTIICRYSEISRESVSNLQEETVGLAELELLTHWSAEATGFSLDVP